MINRETIWNETYRRNGVRPEGSNARIDVFTAIHHTAAGKISTINLCAELQVRIAEESATHVTEITLSPEDMEDLAAYLTEAAQHARELKARIDEDAAEIAAAAEEALRQAKEAA